MASMSVKNSSTNNVIAGYVNKAQLAFLVFVLAAASVGVVLVWDMADKRLKTGEDTPPPKPDTTTPEGRPPADPKPVRQDQTDGPTDKGDGVDKPKIIPEE